jgi:signal transduction histidine kinase
MSPLQWASAVPPAIPAVRGVNALFDRFHLTLRGRLTLAFALATAILLGVAGGAIYLDVEKGLDTSLDASLRSTAKGYARLGGRADLRPLRRALAVEGAPAQLLGARDHVLASSPRGAGAPMLTAAQLHRALAGEVRVTHGETARLLARPAARHRAVVISSPLVQRERALEELGRVLLIGGPLILVLASTAGYLVAAGALRPVERMRRRAAEISQATSDARLPLPATRDELRRLGETLNAMLMRLERTARQERAFLSSASHELRTPLAILRTEVDLALHDGASERELRAALESVGEEADRLQHLCEDLLVIARGRDGSLPVTLRELDLGMLAHDVAGRFAMVSGDVRSGVPQGLVVRADRLRLEQALGNLVDNARRHGAPPIALMARVRDDTVELHVIDHGPGFDATRLDEAFERMGDGAAGGGFGLGLAIVASIAHAHGGSTGVVSGSDGTDVWISVPKAAGTPADQRPVGR